MDLEEEEWVQHSLLDYERRKCISKVLSIEEEDAVPKGDNYASQMYRLKLKVVLNSGDVEDRSVIYKMLPKSPERRIGLKRSGLYTTETRMYLEVFPELEKVQRSVGCADELLWPDCYGVKGRNEGYLLQDLKVLGYKMANRLEGLDMEHAEVVVKSLAKFHALGAVAIERGEVEIRDFDQPFFEKDLEINQMIFLATYNELAKCLEEKWQNEWKEYAKKLRTYMETFTTKLLDCVKRDDAKFNVLSHGDSWLNNLLFKYDAEETPISVRFVDFQLAYYGSPGNDLQYLFHTSLKLGMLKEAESQLLQVYHDSLVENLKLFGYHGNLPTFEYILECSEKARFWGCAMEMAFRPLMMLSSKEAPDMDQLAKDISENRVRAFSRFDNDDENFIRAIKESLRNASDAGFLG